MEASQKLFIDTLENIFEVMRRKESATDYDDLLLNIFDEKHRRAEDLMFMTCLSYGSTIHMDYDELLLSQVIGYAKKETIQLSVIPVVGGCGSGKTSLTRRVYEHQRVKDDFKVRAWVKVDDGQELRLHQAAHGIIKSALNISCSIHELDVLDGIVRETLQSERCLIVFDGVESMSNESWSHMVKHWFDSVDLGSVVLITTSCKQVANLVGQNLFELGKLSEDDAMSLYREFMHHLEKDAPTPLLTKNVAALCGGNPLSITLLGSLTRYYGELLSAVDFSESMSLPAPDASAIILLCVWALPPYLRHCIAYCSLFPTGYALNKQKINRMFAALRYDYAYPYAVDGLITFFTDMTYDDIDEVVEFRMPVLVKDIVEDVARVVYKLNIVGAIGSICDDAGALSLEGEHIKPKDMQTLVLSPTIYLGGSLNHSLAEFTELRLLDLSCSGIHTLSEDIRVLKELRYLNLSYTLIERLPDSVTHLSKLETLDLSWCYHLKALPEGICKLTNMINLDLYQCESLSELPYRIGSLQIFSSMPLFVLGDTDHDHCARLRDLWSLRPFRGTLEIRNLENVKEIDQATRYGVLCNKYLNHLGLSWSNTSRKEADHHNNNCSEILELLEPNKTRLESLDIKGYMGFTFPRWISSMKHLTKIFISDCACEHLPSLGQIKSLRELQLKGMNNIKRIGSGFYGQSRRGVFLSLRKLGIYDMPMLSEWASPWYFDGYVLRTLETLTVEGCPKLASLPSIRQPPNLIVCNSSSQILSSLPIMTIPKSPSSSLLIKDMNLGMSLGEFISRSKSVKTLILFNIEGEFDHPPRFSEEGALLEHLGILHCRQLRDVSLPCIHNLRKVHISDCPNLMFIHVTASFVYRIEELVVEDCGEATTINGINKLGYLRKLIIKTCNTEFDFDYEISDHFLKNLEYLWISGCPKLEERLNKKHELLSHIPVVILGNQKNHTGSSPGSYTLAARLLHVGGLGL